MKPKLKEDMIRSELQESAFFHPPTDKPVVDTIESISEPVDTTLPTDHDTMPPRYRDTTTPHYHDDLLEKIRKALKSYGKEAATYRFTKLEKQALSDPIYAYQKSGVRTSENEITRIAVNFIICDQQEFGEDSILSLVLKLLNS